MMRTDLVPALIALLLAVPAAAQDTVVVRADGPPEWGRSLRLVEELRLGGLDGDPDRIFGSVTDVAVGEDGVLWVADAQAREIRLFDDRGRLERVVGGEGGGPGEFGEISGVERLGDGGMAVWDQRLFRVSLFNADGSFLTSYRVPTDVMIGARGNFVASRNRDVWILGLAKPPGSQDNAFLWVRFAEDGSVRDTLRGRAGEREGPIAVPILNVQAVSPDGHLVEGRSDRWALSWPLADGRVLRVVRDTDPVPFGWAERRETQGRERFFAANRGVDPRPIPGEKPVFRALFVDEEGRVWMHLHAPAIRIPQTDGEKAEAERARALFGAEGMPPPQEWRERALYDVVEPDGRYLGRVELPYWDSRVVAARGRRVWVIQTGPYGEHYVVQYLIEDAG